MPTTFPSATTGSRRICRRAMSRAAWRTSSSGATAARRRDMISFTGTLLGSASGATQRRTMSRSVTMPRRMPSAEHTGSAPRPCRASRRAARAALSSGAMLTTWGVITSFTNKNTHLLDPFSLSLDGQEVGYVFLGLTDPGA